MSLSLSPVEEGKGGAGSPREGLDTRHPRNFGVPTRAVNAIALLLVSDFVSHIIFIVI